MINFINSNAGTLGLLFFFSTFVGVALWAFKPSMKSTIESYKYIPLAEDTNEPKQQ
ncbi:MAG TPA: CcoQ/FixQ family Cbb3-type cytochrome c oxidase assembly chaperone [Gammaproteobacteria bacterium]|jgi:cbb3-type cytochrome oxidase subunit 3|nr:cbb3-type cytochrome c oxidase subunit 3 [Gammaproteobacteria bacterium]HAY41035.1 CcoQ/FixQ family Cbb3-type cytochrome c oxidase assembly chaperone [Gammaproteobacteria bacterium]